MGLCRQNAEQLLLTPEERSKAMDTLLKLDKKYAGRIDAQAGPLAEARRWSMIESARSRGIIGLSIGGYLTGCRCSMSKLAVRADGIMVPCTQLSHMELGRINKDNLKEIWLNHPQLLKLRERNNIPLTNFEFCKGCEYISYCTGNCPALAYTHLGEINHPSPDACMKRFLEAGGRISIA